MHHKEMHGFFYVIINVDKRGGYYYSCRFSKLLK